MLLTALKLLVVAFFAPLWWPVIKTMAGEIREALDFDAARRARPPKVPLGARGSASFARSAATRVSPFEHQRRASSWPAAAAVRAALPARAGGIRQLAPRRGFRATPRV